MKWRVIMTDKKFTPEEIEQLRQNKYVLSVTENKISYSLEFKQFVLKEAEKGLKSPEIVAKSGFDPEILGKPRMYSLLKGVKKQAKSLEGLRASSKKSRDERLAKFAQEDYSKKHTKVAIRELQKKIVHLEQQIEFLKKIQSLDD